MAGTELSQLRAALVERGYHYLLQGGVADSFINLAIEDVCTVDDWPFLERQTDVTTPAEIADLDAVLAVYDSLTGVPLEPVEQWKIRTSPWSATLDTVSRGFWLEGGQTLRTSPAGDVHVAYLKAPTKLVLATDRSDVPERWDDVVLARAEWYAAQHAKNLAIADSQNQSYELGVERMRDRLIDPQRVAGRVMFRYVGEFA